MDRDWTALQANPKWNTIEKLLDQHIKLNWDVLNIAYDSDLVTPKAMLEVTKVANGFLVKIATHEGELAETFIGNLNLRISSSIASSVSINS